jgi:hypothetical protein
MNNKINVTYEDMVALAKISLENSRERTFIPIAIEWMGQANNMFMELKEANKLLKAELEKFKNE